jgi:hypothetical protein
LRKSQLHQIKDSLTKAFYKVKFYGSPASFSFIDIQYKIDYKVLAAGEAS